MTLPPEDRDLIERVCEPFGTLHAFSLNYPEKLSKLLAAARAEAAPVVDEAAVDRAIAAVNAFGPEPMALEDRRRALIRAALEAALNPSPTGGQDHE